LLIRPQNVDVNVHPTKKQVHFLNQDKIIECICKTIEDVLENDNSSKTFQVQTTILSNSFNLNSQIPSNNQLSLIADDKSLSSLVSPTQSNKSAPQHLVRTDSKVIEILNTDQNFRFILI
jgi:DNA mismatch repair protein MLH1